jgi:5-methylcytosine-specific restriction endonuclease McrA
MTIVFVNEEPGKICTYCKNWRPLALFYKLANSRDGYRPDCRPCISKRQKQRYEQKREQISAQQKEYYQRNREKIINRVGRYQREHLQDRRKYIHKYQRDNARRLLDYRRKRWFDNLEESRRKERDYRRNNEKSRAYVRAYERQWRRKNRDKVRAAWHRRRARHRSAGKSFTAKEWIALKEYYNHTCLACGRKEPEIKLTPDHVIPLGPPGTGEISNIQPLCISCNSAKGAQMVDYRPYWSGETS